MPDKDSAVNGVNKDGASAADANGSAGAPTVEKTAEQLLEEANARIVKITEERDNYKTGLLKAKGKIGDDGSPEVDVAEIARQSALAAIAESNLGQALGQKDDLIKKTLKENEELRLAIKNRPNTGTASGTNQDSQKVQDNVLSDAQEKDLRARGWDDKKIEHFKMLSRK